MRADADNGGMKSDTHSDWPDAYVPKEDFDRVRSMLERATVQLSGRSDKVVSGLMREAMEVIKSVDGNVESEIGKLTKERNGAETLCVKVATNAENKIHDLMAALETEREIRKAAEQDFKDLRAFICGEAPKAYNLYTKFAAEPAIKMRSALAEILAIEPVKVGDHWTWELSLRPDEVKDIAREAIAI